MSKTVELQIEKSRNLVEGLRKHLSGIGGGVTSVKEAYADKKKTLKGYYPQERWADYGIPDKR
jgi:hypothetical protein